MTRTRAAYAVTVLAACMPMAAPVAVEAQEASTSLEELLRTRELRIGDGIYVTDAAGQRIKGNVGNLSATALELRTRNGSTTLKAGGIRRIERQDSLENGIGLAILAGFGGAYASCYLEHLASDDYCYATAYSFLPAMAASIFLGAMLDASRHRTIYEAPGPTRVTWSPTVSDRHLGLRAAIAW